LSLSLDVPWKYSVKWKYWNVPCRENEILAYLVIKFDKWEDWKYRNDPCRENEILAYMVTYLINMMVELVPRCLDVPWKYSVKWKYWNVLCRENEILAYLVIKFDKWEDWNCPLILDVNLFCFVISKTKVLEWPFSRKRDCSLFGYKVW